MRDVQEQKMRVILRKNLINKMEKQDKEERKKIDLLIGSVFDNDPKDHESEAPTQVAKKKKKKKKKKAERQHDINSDTNSLNLPGENDEWGN